MEYICRQNGGVVEVGLTEQLTFDDQKLFRQLLLDLKNTNVGHWKVDLSKLDFIDSAGLGLLLRIKALAETENSQVSIRIPADGRVRKMLDLAHFDQLIPFDV